MTKEWETPDIHSPLPTNQPEDRGEENIGQSSYKGKVWQVWQIGAALVVLVSGGVGFIATSSLLKIPQVPECTKVYWPMASASMRLYCAQIKAKEKNADSLLEAIALVEVLPKDNPLRPEINRNVEEWAWEILSLGEQDFQKGNLKESIATAGRIPNYVAAYKMVKEKVDRWNSVWAEAERIYEETEQHLRASNWNQAFRKAVELASVDNKYWSTQKYAELTNNIKVAQEESSKLDSAYAKLQNGNVDNLLEAIEMADEIRSNSYAYQEAQEIISDAKNKLLQHTEKLIENQNWQMLLQVANRLPASLDLQDKIADWNNLASAGSSAEIGTISGLETAIAEAEKIDSNRPLYYEAQQLVNHWKLEIEDLSHLSRARQLAQQGGVKDLSEAIASAQLIPKFNPRYEEAQREVQDWNRQIQIIEDMPALNRAKQLARLGNLMALEEAIAQADTIAPNRALYQEAQNRIRQWQSSIQRQQDRPIVDRAVSLARLGNYSAAIEMAERIRWGRVLHQEAQAKIRVWQQEIQAGENLNQAYQLASMATPDSLGKAISLARLVPFSTSLRSKSTQAISLWADQLLAISKERAASSLQEAISIAEKIPSEASVYNSAKSQIEMWKRKLNTPDWLEQQPIPLPETISPSPESSPNNLPTNTQQQPEN